MWPKCPFRIASFNLWGRVVNGLFYLHGLVGFLYGFSCRHIFDHPLDHIAKEWSFADFFRGPPQGTSRTPFIKVSGGPNWDHTIPLPRFPYLQGILDWEDCMGAHLPERGSHVLGGPKKNPTKKWVRIQLHPGKSLKRVPTDMYVNFVQRIMDSKRCTWMSQEVSKWFSKWVINLNITPFISRL